MKIEIENNEYLKLNEKDYEIYFSIPDKFPTDFKTNLSNKIKNIKKIKHRYDNLLDMFYEIEKILSDTNITYTDIFFIIPVKALTYGLDCMNVINKIKTIIKDINKEITFYFDSDKTTELSIIKEIENGTEQITINTETIRLEKNKENAGNIKKVTDINKFIADTELISKVIKYLGKSFMEQYFKSFMEQYFDNN